MLTSIPSLDSIVQCLLPAFTQPSFQTHIEVLLGWVMGLGKRTEYGVFQATQADAPASRKERHPFDRFYNIFSRSAWIVHDLAHQVAVAIVIALDPRGVLYLVVDDTLLHKRGKRVYCLPIQAPHHGCRESIQKLSPWVWLMQSLISLWYFIEGHKLPQARTARRRFGDWDTPTVPFCLPSLPVSSNWSGGTASISFRPLSSIASTWSPTGRDTGRPDRARRSP